MIGRTPTKLNNTVNELVTEFRRKGKVLPRENITQKNMDFNEPSTVEKNFQNVRYYITVLVDVKI